MNDSTELKECPFCGRIPTYDKLMGCDYGLTKIHCLCGANMTDFHDVVVDVWNSRAAMAAAPMADFALRERVAVSLGLGESGMRDGKRIGFAWEYLLGMIADMAKEEALSAAHVDADFETWARAEFGCGFDGDDYLFIRGDDGFEDDRVAGAWAAWQHLTAAAKSAAPVDDEYCTLCAFPKGHAGCKCAPSAAPVDAQTVRNSPLLDEFLAVAKRDSVKHLTMPANAAPEAPSATDDVDDDAYTIYRMGKLLAEIAVALKGPEQDGQRHGYHDLHEVALARVFEIEMLKQRLAEAAAAPAAPSGAQDAETDLSKCPTCGGPADNGHDREFPPNPYDCQKCCDGDHKR